MKLPRDLSGEELAALLRRYGYEVTRQTGSHMRLTTLEGGEHHLTIRATTPCGSALSVGFSEMLRSIWAQTGRH